MQASLHWVNRESNCGLENEVGAGWGAQEVKQTKILRDAREKNIYCELIHAKW